MSIWPRTSRWVTNHSREIPIFLIAFTSHSIFFFLLLWRQGWGFWLQPQDAGVYAVLAKNLINYKSYINYAGTMPASWFTPGYPVFLAVIFYVFKSWLPIIIIQNILASMSAVIVYTLGKTYLSKTTGFAAALIFAIEPTNAYISNFLWSESIFLFVFLLTIMFFMKFLYVNYGTSMKLYAVLAGLLLASAIYVRQIAFFFPLILSVIFLTALLIYKTTINKKRIVAFIILIAVVTTAIFPYLVRNKILFDTWQIGGSGTTSFYFFYAVPFSYYRNASSKIAYLVGLEDPAKPEHGTNLIKFNEKYSYHRNGGLYYAKFLEHKGKNIIGQHIFEYSFFHAVSGFGGIMFQDTWQYILKRMNYGKPGLKRAIISLDIKKITANLSTGKVLWFAATAFGHLVYLTISVLALVGIIVGARKRQRAQKRIFIIMSASVFLYFAIMTGPQAYRERYRYPTSAFLLYLASEGYLNMKRRPDYDIVGRLQR